MTDRKDEKDDIECMWKAARNAEAEHENSTSVPPIAPKVIDEDLGDIEVSPAFKPIKAAAAAPTSDDYKVAMTGPAAFMDPAPAKPDVKPVQKESLVEIVRSTNAESAKEESAAANKSGRSKLPIYAAVAASFACIAVIGAQSWPSATASDTPVGEYRSDITASAQNTAPAMAVASVQDSGEQQAIAQPQSAAVQVAGTRSSFNNAIASAQVAMAQPVMTQPIMTQPVTAQPSAPIIVAKALPVDPVPLNPEPKQAEFVPLKSGISKIADHKTGLSRSDCAARFQMVSRSGSIRFEKGSATLKKSSEPILIFFAKVFELCNEFTIAVAGHTDATGDANYNQALSEKRATSVAKYLVGLDIPTEKLRIIGYGESKPLASNDTNLKRARNRRIEFLVHDG